MTIERKLLCLFLMIVCLANYRSWKLISIDLQRQRGGASLALSPHVVNWIFSGLSSAKTIRHMDRDSIRDFHWVSKILLSSPHMRDMMIVKIFKIISQFPCSSATCPYPLTVNTWDVSISLCNLYDNKFPFSWQQRANRANLIRKCALAVWWRKWFKFTKTQYQQLKDHRSSVKGNICHEISLIIISSGCGRAQSKDDKK